MNSIIERARRYQEKAKSIGETSFPDWTDELVSALLDAVRALEFYAGPAFQNEECNQLIRDGGFFPYGIEECPIAEDGGEKARAALRKLQGEE